MVNLKLSIAAALAFAAFATVAGQNLIAPRLIGGVGIDTLRRFPHHVSIKAVRNVEDGERCGGTILSDLWVLTSARCVDRSIRLQMHFEKLYANNTAGSYTAVVNSDAIHIYPTYYDDIALVKLPFRLIFSDLIKPVVLGSSPIEQLENKLAVLPGFDANEIKNGESSTAQSQQLTYAMLNVIPNSQCKLSYKYDFDEYLQLCTLGWGNNKNTPCVTDFGSGLIIGWPAKSEIVGIYSSTSYDCNSDYPAVYTNVAKYTSWIQSLINS